MRVRCSLCDGLVRSGRVIRLVAAADSLAQVAGALGVGVCGGEAVEESSCDGVRWKVVQGGLGCGDKRLQKR